MAGDNVAITAGVGTAVGTDERSINGTNVHVTTSTAVGIVHDASTAGGSITSGTQRTFAHTIGGGSNRLLVVAVGIESTASPTLSSVTYNGVALTQAVSQSTVESTVQTVHLYYALEANLPAAGTYNVVVTLANALSSGQMICAATSVSGAAQVAPVTNSSQSGVDGTTYSTSITTIAGTSWVFDAIGGNNSTTWTPNGGQDERSDQQAGGNFSALATSTKPLTTAGATTLGWTASGNQGRFAHALAAWPAAIAYAAPAAGLASGTGTAHDATVRTAVTPAAGLASGTGTAHDATVKISVNAETASGTGSAFNASIPSTGSAAKIRLAGNWAIAPIFIRSGGQWVEVKAKIRSGGQWVEV